MAEWFFRFDNTPFTDNSGIYGSQNYTPTAEDMPVYPYDVADMKMSNNIRVDNADLFVYRKALYTKFSLNFVDVSGTCMATMRRMFRDDIHIRVIEDINSALNYTFFGTGTFHIVDEEVQWTNRDELFSFNLTFEEVVGTKNEA